VIVGRGLVHRQHFAVTAIAVRQPRGPDIARSRREHPGEAGLHHRPLRRVVLIGENRIAGEVQRFQQAGEELGFDRPYGDELSVRAYIAAVKRRPTVEQVLPASPVPHPVVLERPHARHHHRGAICHAAIDDPAPAALPRRQQGRDEPERQHHAATAVVADQVQRRRGWMPFRADRGEQAAERYVVQVVPGLVRQRAGLSPPGHAGVNQRRIARHQHLRPKAQSLRHAGTEAFDQTIRGLNELRDDLDAFRLLEVQRDGTARAQEDVAVLRLAQGIAAPRPVDADHFRPMVGKHHSAKRSGADTGQFDHPQPLKRRPHQTAAGFAFPRHATRQPAPMIPIARRPMLAGGSRRYRDAIDRPESISLSSITRTIRMGRWARDSLKPTYLICSRLANIITQEITY
jgi:hypothetical protein